MSNKTAKDIQAAAKKPLDPSHGEPTHEGLTYVPEVDIFESLEAITVRADLPGALKKSVQVDVQEGVLTLTAKNEPIDEKWQLIHREYEPGGFTRRFTLSERVDVDRINAKFDSGVLTVELPKAEKHKPRHISVT